MALTLKIRKKEKLPVDNTKDENGLIIWWHYNIYPSYYLVPINKISDKTKIIIEKSHQSFILRKLTPIYVAEMRNLLFNNYLGSLKKYKIPGNTLIKDICWVCVTGQLG